MASLSRGASRDSVRPAGVSGNNSNEKLESGIASGEVNEKGQYAGNELSKHGSKGEEDDIVALQRMGIANQIGEDGGVRRDLKSRHIAMLALGGTIGTGLFIGLGSSLAQAGPLSTLLGFIIMGFFVWALMVALGEMATFLPAPGGFVHHASRFVDPSMGAALAWSYWFSYGITIPTELQASALIISFWDPEQKINPAVWITILMVFVCAVNFLGVRVFGEVEFWFASIKVVMIVVLIITCLVIDVGGGPSGEYIGGKYWQTPGAMAQLFWTPDANNNPTGGISGSWGRFLAFWQVFISAAFSLAGTEIVGMTVGEVENPRKNVPKAIKGVAYRIITFYVLAVLLVGLCVPYTDPRLLSDSSNASASPYVIAIESAGIKVFPHIVNAVLVTVTWSAGQSDLYASSRTLYGLALEGNAPRIFKKCTKGGLPIYAVAATALFAPLAYMGTSSEGVANVFLNLYDISAVSLLIAWWCIVLTYIRFYHGLKQYGLSRDKLPYKAPFQPYASYAAFLFFSLVILLSGFTVFIRGQWDSATFVVNYICIPVFFILWIGYKLVSKSKWVALDQMDFETGRRTLDALEGEKSSEEEEAAERARLAEMSPVKRAFEKASSFIF